MYKTKTLRDLIKMKARTVKAREIEKIIIEVHPYDNTIYVKRYEFTNGDTLALTYFDKDLNTYHFITSDYNSVAYFYLTSRHGYVKAS